MATPALEIDGAQELRLVVHNGVILNDQRSLTLMAAWGPGPLLHDRGRLDGQRTVRATPGFEGGEAVFVQRQLAGRFFALAPFEGGAPGFVLL